MFTKRNIAIYFGLLLALMSACVSTAAAENIELGLSVSPENLVIGTNAKWISVVFHVEDYNDNYVADDIDPESIILKIVDAEGHENVIGDEIGENADRFEITDADGDYLNELVLIYLASDLLDEDFTYGEKGDAGLKFYASGTVGTDTFTASCTAKTTMTKGGNKGGEGKPGNPGNPGNGKGKPENPGNGR